MPVEAAGVGMIVVQIVRRRIHACHQQTVILVLIVIVVHRNQERRRNLGYLHRVCKFPPPCPGHHHHHLLLLLLLLLRRQATRSGAFELYGKSVDEDVEGRQTGRDQDD